MDPIVASWAVKIVARQQSLEALGTPDPSPVPVAVPTNEELERVIANALEFTLGLTSSVNAERTDK